MSIENVIVGDGTLTIDGQSIGIVVGGVMFELETDIAPIESDQEMSPLGFFKVRERLHIRTVLAEATLKNIQLAWRLFGTPETEGTVETLYFGGDREFDFRLLEFQGTGPNKKTRHITVYRVISMESVRVPFTRGIETMIPVVFEAVEDVTQPVGRRLGKMQEW